PRLPLLSRQLRFPQADVVRRHLDRLVLTDQLERLLERERARREETHELLGGRGADVRQLLLLRRVDVQVVGPRVLADDHALVNLDPWADEELAAFLEVQESERRCGAAAIGDEAAGRSRAQLAVPRLVA